MIATNDVNYAYHTLKRAMLMDDSVVFIEYELLYNKRGEDITIISCLKMVDDVLIAVQNIEDKISVSCKVINKKMKVIFTFDHRVINGVMGAKFVMDFKEELVNV